MILKPFLHRHFLMTSAVFLTIFSIAYYLSHFLTHLDHAEYVRDQGGRFFSVVENHEGDKVGYVRQLNTLNTELGLPVEIDVIRDGKSLLNGAIREIPEDNDLANDRIFTHDISLPEPAKFVVSFSALKGRVRRGVRINFAVICVAILIASALSMFLLFWNFRDRAEMAKSILKRMQHGDLKARFPTSRLDEIGQIMLLFNQMADEIQRLVEQLKQNETQRIQLLQELTHDLRTPVASLHNLIETLRFDQERLTDVTKAELMALAFQETDYLARLVDDLLFLALVLEPKYTPETGDVFVAEIFQTQCDAALTSHPKIRLEYETNPSIDDIKLAGNPHLLQRLFRNALENAFSFAKSKVTVGLEETPEGLIVITITDDGPGLEAEALANFGKKRSTRNLGERQEGRISIGLGSVIIFAITRAYGGTVAITNVSDPSDGGKPRGAKLKIQLPSQEGKPAPQSSSART